MPSKRFDRLPYRFVYDREVPVATGLLIPRCASVHTFGMRFPLDIYFLDADGAVVSTRLTVPPRRFVACRGAVAVLEVPG